MSKARQISDADDRSIRHELRGDYLLTNTDLTDRWRIRRDSRTRRKVSEALRARIARLQELLAIWEAT